MWNCLYKGSFKNLANRVNEEFANKCYCFLSSPSSLWKTLIKQACMFLKMSIERWTKQKITTWKIVVRHEHTLTEAEVTFHLLSHLSISSLKILSAPQKNVLIWHPWNKEQTNNNKTYLFRNCNLNI